jgi:hypothetical protein
VITTILVLLTLVVIVLIIVVALRPNHFSIARSAMIPASPAALFAEVNDFHRWNAWSPWARMDPASNKCYEGAASGEGAVFRWAGNKQVGEGRMTLMESHPDRLIRIKLEFVKPFKATNTVEFTFEPSGDQTVVRWSMSGPTNFVGKAIGLVLNCEKMIGRQYEQGLENLKLVVTQDLSVIR